MNLARMLAALTRPFRRHQAHPAGRQAPTVPPPAPAGRHGPPRREPPVPHGLRQARPIGEYTPHPDTPTSPNAPSPDAPPVAPDPDTTPIPVPPPPAPPPDEN